MSIRDLSDDYLGQCTPKSPSGLEVRQSWFRSAYSRFVVAHYHSDAGRDTSHAHDLGACPGYRREECLDADQLPLQGSRESRNPADITDEIRSLDERYDPAKIGLPAAYVIAEQFWMLLVKATPLGNRPVRPIELPSYHSACAENHRLALNNLSEVAYV